MATNKDIFEVTYWIDAFVREDYFALYAGNSGNKIINLLNYGVLKLLSKK
ncbi:MAG: hypothetical protein R6W78_16960 [Bacteroidales bacterium]